MVKREVKLVVIITLLISIFGVPAVVLGQANDKQGLQEAFAQIKALGPNLNPELIADTGRLFASIHKTTEKGQVQRHIDIQYASDEKNLLDVYWSASSSEADSGRKPAVVFIHGGGLVGGDKDNSLSELMYANVATFFARHQMVGINATYRLVPDIVYPQGAEDMQGIITWIRANADNYQIDPNKIFFLCASAGCTHVSSLLFDPSMQFENDPDIAGAIMLSGAYQAANVDYFGSDARVRESRSAFSLAEEYTGRPIPVFLMSAQYDPNAIEAGTARLYSILCNKRDECPRFAQARDHNHISINQHINTVDERYTDMMLEFIEETITPNGSN